MLTVLTVLKPLQTSVVLLACWLSGCGPDWTAPEGGEASLGAMAG